MVACFSPPPASREPPRRGGHVSRCILVIEGIILEKKKYWPLTLAAFADGCLLMAAVYFCLGWWPFGTGTVLTGDLRGLYVNYITDMWARVKEGGFFYSFGKLAGGSTLGLFAYYMNSPFNLLFLLLPTRMVPQAAGLIFLLRTGVTAAAFCWYLQRHFAKADPLFAVLAQCYAFCAFCIVYNQNIIWMDVVWLLPLVLAALDDLMRRGRHWGFTGLILLCILLNFYIAWPVCLFSILYFLCLWPSQGQGELRRRFGCFAASGVLAAALSLFFLLPVLLEVQESKGGLFDFTFSLTPQFNLLQLPYRLFFGNFFWNDVTNGLPNIYCGVVLVPLVLLYFCGNAPRREKLGFAALLAALAGSFWIKGIDRLWHGMKQPVWFPYRYSFLFSAVVILLAARVLTGGPQRRRAWGLAAGLTAVWLAGYPLAAGAELFSRSKLAAAAGLCAASLVAAWFLLEKPALNKRRLLYGAAALLTAADLGANTLLALRKFEQFDLADFTDFYDNAALAVTTAKTETDGDCRIEKNFLHTLNDPFLLGYWGISHYSSTKASTAKELLEQLGYVGYSTYGWGSTGVADSLLGIRWLYSDGSRPVAGHWQPVDCDSAYTLYKNDAAFPLAYLAHRDALAVDADALDDNTFTLQNAMLQSLTGSEDTALVSVEPTFSVTEKGTVQVDFTAPITGPAYLAIPGTDEQLPMDVVIDGELYAQYFEPESLGGVICLPSFTAGQQVTLVLGIADDAVFHTNTQIYQLDSAALDAARQQVQAVDADIREGGAIDVTCTVHGGNDLLVLSFAYDENWAATVNGEPVQPVALFGGLLALPLPQGGCTVTLRYTHPGVLPGAAGSLAALAAALGWMAWERKKKIGKPQT